ncbi:MAG TPA: hypothetical protein VF796_25445 [Humisphaera sp.]
MADDEPTAGEPGQDPPTEGGADAVRGKPVLDYSTLPDAPAAQPVLQYSTVPDAAEMADRRWVHLWTAQSTFDANLVVNKLDAEGIPARVDMENAAALGHWGISGPGGTQVQVPAALVDDARAVLDAIERQKEARRAATSVRCPECGHLPATRTAHPARQAAVAMLVAAPVAAVGLIFLGASDDVRLLAFGALVVGGLSALFATVTPRWRCSKCGCRWAQPEPVEDEPGDDLEAGGRRVTADEVDEDDERRRGHRNSSDD